MKNIQDIDLSPPQVYIQEHAPAHVCIIHGLLKDRDKKSSYFDIILNLKKLYNNTWNSRFY